MAESPSVDADEEFRNGKLALSKKDYAEAAEHFSAAVETFVGQHGQLASECGELYYYYGLALFREVEQQEENQDVFGSAVPREIPTGRAADSVTESSSSGPSSSSAAHPSSTEPAEIQENNNTGDGEDEDSKEDDDGQENEESGKPALATEGQGNADGDNVEDPLQLAWEVLDTARTIFERDSETQELRLADTLLLLGDVNLRNEMFDNAVQDYEKCLELRTQRLKPDDRLIMEVLHQIAVAKLNYTDPKMAEVHRDAAVKALRKAIQVCELRITNLNKILANDCGVGDLETSIIPKSRGDVEEEINELEAIKEELEQRIDSEETVGDAPEGQGSGSNQAMALGGGSLQAVLEQAGLGNSGTQIGFGAPVVPDASGAVKSLGVFGKRKAKASEPGSASDLGKGSADGPLNPVEKKARVDAAPDGAEMISGAATPATLSPPKLDGTSEGNAAV